MLRVERLEVANWKPTEKSYLEYETPEGYKISSEVLEQVCKLHGIPATLVAVDNKYKTHTTKTVLQTALKEEPKFVIKDDVVLNALNPKSIFVTDDKFESFVEDANKIGLKDFRITKNNASIRATFELEVDDSKNYFNNDLFRKRVILERMSEGGLLLNIELLRQVCSNGQLLSDSQFKKVFHKSEIGEEVLKTFIADAHVFDLAKYFESLWNKNGEPVMASVADYFGMKKTLRDIAGEEIADFKYPTDTIKDFYQNQGIDVEALPRSMQAKLPSGLSYYDTFNFLTHGATLIEKTLNNEIEIAKWSKPTKLNQMKQSDLIFKGMPHFAPELIKSLRGDK